LVALLEYLKAEILVAHWVEQLVDKMVVKMVVELVVMKVLHLVGMMVL
jgi:hypothetical protein